MTWGAVHTVNECVVDSCERHISPDLIHSSILSVPELQSNLVLLFINQSINPHILSLPSVPTGSSLGIASCRPQMETDRQRGGEGVTHRGRRDGGLQPDEDKVDLRERFRLEREDWRRGGGEEEADWTPGRKRY